ncbi:hypothetical protein B0T16DRAFT_490202 [Cercophora newfieldiana]|uniref:Uncharacterized protein n=1 Tax=Cercophora newfieldiana TaxID=92897 RepID=A0AA40CUV4_9PEZI|nr:hypothetical protein B0T16DRAFT_490202 [Cercophora newfieldiana]
MVYLLDFNILPLLILTFTLPLYLKYIAWSTTAIATCIGLLLKGEYRNALRAFHVTLPKLPRHEPEPRPEMEREMSMTRMVVPPPGAYEEVDEEELMAELKSFEMGLAVPRHLLLGGTGGE